LPFKEQVFEAVVCMNAFEHYRKPDAAMAEIRRILKPGGRLYLHTAFLQPLHEAPHHYYNCTEFGLRQWLHDFEGIDIRVSSNFNPVYTLSWLASEVESAFREGVSEDAARRFAEARFGEVMMFWRDGGTRTSPLWRMFYELPEAIQRRFAAGWEARATKAAEQDPPPPAHTLLAANSSNGVG
jgi:SAM-dependent methyltransferase